jgi:1-acyl-sn-glycerol-3-phosphate acyltransferase
MDWLNIYYNAHDEMNNLLFNICCYPIRLFFWILLKFLGWNFLSQKDHDILLNESKMVLVFSHTTLWDFWLIFFHMIVYPNMTKNVYTSMSSSFFNKWYGFILKRFQFIPTVRLEDKSIGFVNIVTNSLKNRSEYAFMISPEGKLNKSPWRSGYYYIAKNLNVPIYAIGFDYELKKLVLGKRRHPNEYESKEQIEKLLQYDMSQIVPLYPQNSFVEIRSHSKLNRYWCDVPTVIINTLLFLYLCKIYIT